MWQCRAGVGCRLPEVTRRPGKRALVCRVHLWLSRFTSSVRKGVQSSADGHPSGEQLLRSHFPSPGTHVEDPEEDYLRLRLCPQRLALSPVSRAREHRVEFSISPSFSPPIHPQHTLGLSPFSATPLPLHSVHHILLFPHLLVCCLCVEAQSLYEILAGLELAV